jgi:hypothetical protein
MVLRVMVFVKKKLTHKVEARLQFVVLALAYGPIRWQINLRYSEKNHNKILRRAELWNGHFRK